MYKLFFIISNITVKKIAKREDLLIKKHIFAIHINRKNMSYLKIPIDLQSAVNGKLERCSYEESIAQQIMLLIVSHYGEVASKEDFGSAIWELEFSQLIKTSDWESQVQESLQKSICSYEQRLKEVNVSVILSEIDDENKKNIHIRRKAQITVTGKICSTDQPFHFTTLIYISPLSQ